LKPTSKGEYFFFPGTKLFFRNSPQNRVSE
jgi:hypothetical protein